MMRKWFCSLNIIPVQYLYKTNVILKCKQCFQCSNKTFISLCNLNKPTEVSYNFRDRNIWSQPFSRTNYGFLRIQYRVPCLLNKLRRNSIDLNSVSWKNWNRIWSKMEGLPQTGEKKFLFCILFVRISVSDMYLPVTRAAACAALYNFSSLKKLLLMFWKLLLCMYAKRMYCNPSQSVHNIVSLQ